MTRLVRLSVTFLLSLLLVFSLSFTPQSFSPRQTVHADTANIHPNADGTITSFETTGTAHYTEIDEGTTPNTDDHISAAINLAATGYFNMSTISSVDTVSQIVVYIYHNDGSNGQFFAQLYNDDETTTYSSETGFTTSNTDAWHSITFSGLSLTQAQLDALSIRIKLDRSGGGAPATGFLYTMYAEVTYTPASAVSISITSDGSVAFGTQALDSTHDTTSSDLNDIETVSVDTGPADLDIKSTDFSDTGSNTWTLSTGNGTNQVHFEYSKDGTNWSSFSTADTNYIFDTNVAQSDTRNIYLRLTTPTTTGSYDQHSATVTIIASTPS